jgi:glutamate N-acetyltransferase/amino-acid N-acetyltransferase
MAVGLSEPRQLLPVAGVRLAAIGAGIKPNKQRDDLVMIALDPGTTCASVFTRNAFCAAPVIVARQHLDTTPPRALLINSGNANAGTGQQGLDDASESCARVAEALGCLPQEVLPFSTGVIGENLPMTKLNAGIEAVAGRLDENSWMAAARGIMTTDTIAKACSRQISIDGTTITLTGFAKGSGMIHPDMATMLAFIFTDANTDADFLRHCLKHAADASFNCITVDGDTSTNDACILAATGKSGSEKLTGASAGSAQFAVAVEDVCTQLAQAIIRDGEGATKFVTVHVTSAASVEEARNVAFTIAHSPLVKTALFASDPNWGRILAAVGRAGIADLQIDGVDIYLDDVCIVEHGARAAMYTEEQGQQVMKRDEITITVSVSRGEAAATIWTTDLSHDYVTINSEYRS